MPWSEALILPIGDVQLGAEGYAGDVFKRWMEWGVKHKAYYVGLGDYVDVASPSGREKVRHAEFYDSVKDDMDDIAQQRLEQFQKAVDGTQGRWLGLVSGHHYWDFQDHTNTDSRLAEYLGCPYSESAAVVQVKFDGVANHRTHCNIYLWHGEGSGMTMAAPLNKLERLMSRWPTVDIFLMGHYSRVVHYKVGAMVPVFGKKPYLREAERILACTGGFSKGYVIGSQHGGTYVERAGMPPTNLGSLKITVCPIHTGPENHQGDTIHMEATS